MTREDLVGRLMDSPAGMEWWAAPTGTGQWADRLPCAHGDGPGEYTHQVQAQPAPWELLVCRAGVVHLRHLPERPDPGDRVERAALRETLAAVEALVLTRPTDQEEHDMPDQDREHHVSIRQSGAVNIAVAAGDLAGLRIELPGVTLRGGQDQADDDDQD